MFAATSDGAKVTNHMHQVMAGFKIVDVAAIGPITNRLIKPQTRNVFGL